MRFQGCNTRLLRPDRASPGSLTLNLRVSLGLSGSLWRFGVPRSWKTDFVTKRSAGIKARLYQLQCGTCYEPLLDIHVTFLQTCDSARLAPGTYLTYTCCLAHYYAVSHNIEKRLLASSCPSVCPHGTTRLPTGRIFMELDI